MFLASTPSRPSRPVDPNATGPHQSSKATGREAQDVDQQWLGGRTSANSRFSDQRLDRRRVPVLPVWVQRLGRGKKRRSRLLDDLSLLGRCEDSAKQRATHVGAAFTTDQHGCGHRLLDSQFRRWSSRLMDEIPYFTRGKHGKTPTANLVTPTTATSTTARDVSIGKDFSDLSCFTIDRGGRAWKGVCFQPCHLKRSVGGFLVHTGVSGPSCMPTSPRG